MLFGHLALGTTVTLEFYAADPANSESTPERTLAFTYAEDSETALGQSFAEAQANAGYVTINVGEQTQTLELPSDTSADSSNNDGYRRGGVYGAFYGALPLRGLGEGSSVNATFYDGDPASDAQTLQTLTFTSGQDSEAGFATDFREAAQQAAYVTVTTSPQTTTVNLSDVASRFGDFGRGGVGNDFYRGGPGGCR